MDGVRKRVRWNLLIAISALAVALPLAADSARATVISFPLFLEFSQGTAPVFPATPAAPWLVATFDDSIGPPGSVTLTMSDLNLTGGPGGGEHVKNWNFNLNPALDPTLLSFSAPTTVSGKFGSVTPTAAENFFQANGDGLFDIMFLFADTNGANTKFGSGDAVSFEITSSETITAGSFDFLSVMDGLPFLLGIFPTAAQIQGIGANDESGWISTPEPSTAALLIVGGIGLLPLLRRRGKR